MSGYQKHNMTLLELDTFILEHTALGEEINQPLVAVYLGYADCQAIHNELLLRYGENTYLENAPDRIPKDRDAFMNYMGIPIYRMDAKRHLAAIHQLPPLPTVETPYHEDLVNENTVGEVIKETTISATIHYEHDTRDIPPS